jgi:hypothetical protein
MKKLLSVFLSLTIMLSTAAVLSVPASVSAASKTGKKYASYKTVSKTIKKEGVLILTGKIKYPVLKSKSKAAKKVNKKIKKYVKSYADQITKMAKNEYSNNGTKNFKTTGQHYQYDVKAKFTYNKSGKYSFRISYYGYTMGAHGYEHVEGCTFKKSSGKKISNAKVTKYSGEKLKSKIVSKMEKKIAEEPAKYFTWAVNTINNRDINAFNIWLKGKYAYVHFDPYDISSYVAGPTEIKIKL